jgi:hypothetical protein
VGHSRNINQSLAAGFIRSERMLEACGQGRIGRTQGSEAAGSHQHRAAPNATSAGTPMTDFREQKIPAALPNVPRRSLSDTRDSNRILPRNSICNGADGFRERTLSSFRKGIQWLR